MIYDCMSRYESTVAFKSYGRIGSSRLISQRYFRRIRTSSLPVVLLSVSQSRIIHRT